jgi:FdhD protein
MLQKNMSKVKNIILKSKENALLVEKEDLVACEEPLEIRLEYGDNFFRQEIPVSVTMRTPDHDAELAAGFLFSEGIIFSPSDLLGIEHCRTTAPDAVGNVIRVRLQAGFEPDKKKISRNFFVHSSCGICGKASLESLKFLCHFPESGEIFVQESVILALSKTLLENQSVFKYTGGIHAAALFDLNGKMLAIREDVGRHNALDKLIGKYFLEKQLPLTHQILFLSGRVSFELLQKAVVAGIKIVCAVGAPSSLAVETAEKFGLTLIAFLRENKYNLYAGKALIMCENIR